MGNLLSHLVSEFRIPMYHVASLALFLQAIAGSAGLAQVSTNITPSVGTAGLETTVTTDGHTVLITGGTRPSNGVNLFHSFHQFNVGPGDTAQFLNTSPSLPTSNILSRITSNNPSSIFGTINTMSYPDANLFLMNPAGIVFGPDATLHVGGSVAFTTANYLRLAAANGSNAGIFYANTSATNLLTNAPIAAFGFLNSDAAAIAVQGSTLELRQPDQSISLVGGNQGFSVASVSVPDGVTLTNGHFSVSSGQINIASVASAGEILTATLDHVPNIDRVSFIELGMVSISENSTINSSGVGGGTIVIRGGRFVLDDSTLSANTTAIGTTTDPQTSPPVLGIDIKVTKDVVINNGAIVETNVESGAHHASGGVRIIADHITVSGGQKTLNFVETNPDADTPIVGIISSIGPESTADRGGNISLTANSILIKDLGQIRTHTDSTGNAGNLILNGTAGIETNRASLFSTAGDSASGQSGNITLISSQGNVSLINTAITSQTGDNGGNASGITISARQGNVLLDGTQMFNFIGEGTGTLGGVRIEAHDLDLRNRSSIAGNNFSTPVAGNIEITLEGLLALTGKSRIKTDALGPANAANLIVKARDIAISGESRLTSETGSSGTGGTINVTATNQISLTTGASITASSIENASGNAGNISINAGQQLEMLDGASIKTTTDSAQANGGNIDIRAIDRIRLVDSTISTSVKGAEGSGGNIFIDPKVVMLEGSNVTAQAVGGTGGNITFVTPLFLQDSASTVSATSQRGVSGTVTIQSPTSNLSGTVGQLASKTNPPQVLLQNRCIALAGSEQSTFILAGRDALPSEPGGWLSSPVAMEHWTGEVPEEHVSRLMVRSRGWNRQPPLVMSKDETTMLSLRRLTPPGFLIRTFATDTTGCPA